MYKLLIRPLLFEIYAEKVHTIIKKTLHFSFAIPGLKQITRAYYQVNDPRLERELFGLKFKNPVGIAAGFDKNAEMYNDLAEFGFGHIEIGTITPKAQDGNPKPRIFRLVKTKPLSTEWVLIMEELNSL